MGILNALLILDRIKWFGMRKLYWKIRKDPYHIDSLFNKKDAKNIINLYSGDKGQNLDNTDNFLGFGFIHYSFIRNIRPNNILCIGSRKGFIPSLLALACRDNHMGHVFFIDAGYGKEMPAKHWSGCGFWKNNNAKTHFGRIGVSKYITTFLETSQEYAHAFPKRRYQYVYIDGDHSFQGVSLDYSLFWPLLDKGGLMIFHDISARGKLDKGIFGVWRFWKKLKPRNSIFFPFPNHSGLGIIQKI